MRTGSMVAAGALSLGAALSIAVLAGNEAIGKYEEPEYKLIERAGKIEIRQYKSRVAAEVQLSGDQRTVLNKGFKILANYIFGGNHPGQEIAMTAPVSRQAGKKIEMTAPVSAQRTNDEWTVRFFMPSRFKLDELPLPNDSRVKLVELPDQIYVVSCFSGNWGERNFEKHRRKLRDFARKKELVVKGQAIDAYYNPPFTLPFLRRNEVMLPISLREVGS